MEISLEDRISVEEEPEEFDNTLDDGMYSDCEYGEEEETMEEEDDYGRLSDVGDDGGPLSADLAPAN